MGVSAGWKTVDTIIEIKRMESKRIPESVPCKDEIVLISFFASCTVEMRYNTESTFTFFSDIINILPDSVGELSGRGPLRRVWAAALTGHFSLSAACKNLDL